MCRADYFDINTGERTGEEKVAQSKKCRAHYMYQVCRRVSFLVS